MKSFVTLFCAIALLGILVISPSCRAPKEKPRISEEQKRKQDSDKQQYERVLEKETGSKKK